MYDYILLCYIYIIVHIKIHNTYYYVWLSIVWLQSYRSHKELQRSSFFPNTHFFPNHQSHVMHFSLFYAKVYHKCFLSVINVDIVISNQRKSKLPKFTPHTHTLKLQAIVTTILFCFVSDFLYSLSFPKYLRHYATNRPCLLHWAPFLETTVWS